MKKNKYYIFGAVLIIVLLLIGGVYFFDNPNHVRVGDLNFKVPDGYTKNENNDYVNLSNGVNSICISKNVGNDVKSNIGHYINAKKSKHMNVTVDKFMMDNVEVTQLDIVKDNHTRHYIFDIDGKVYDIFTWNKSQETNSLFTYLLKSALS